MILPPLLLLGVGFSLELLKMNKPALSLLPTSLTGSALAMAATLGQIGANLNHVVGDELVTASNTELAAQLRGKNLAWPSPSEFSSVMRGDARLHARCGFGLG